MFKQIFTALRQGESLDRAFAEFGQMLEHAHWMFGRANAVLKRETPAEEAREAVYQRDQSINELLRSVRAAIVRHLTFNPGSDVAACLALMSVAKDAERIGDYCKNVFEVGQFYTEDFHVPKYHEPLEEIRVDAQALVGEVQRAFKASDTSTAKDAIRKADSIADRCDEIIEQLLHDSTEMATHESVAYSLLARHYKRVAAHLANIATAVFGKIEDLDFRKRK